MLVVTHVLAAMLGGAVGILAMAVLVAGGQSDGEAAEEPERQQEGYEEKDMTYLTD